MRLARPAAALLATAAALCPLALAAQAPDPALEKTKTEAEDAYKRGDYNGAITLADSVLKRSPNDHVALYLRGSSRVEQGVQKGDADQLRAGIADAREAIRLGGGGNSMYYLPYLYGMTHLALSENRKEHAAISVQVADQALANTALKPDEKANLTYQRGLANAAQGEIDKAAADHEAAIRLNPKLLAAYTAVADLFARTGRADQARQAFDRAVAAFPENPLVYNNRGMFLQQTGRLDEAVGDFTRAIELDPNYYFSFTNRGFTLLKKDDAQAAEADFNASLRINPNQPMVYSMRGTAKLMAGKADLAIEDHRKAAELAPGSPDAQTELGFALYFAGRPQEALAAWDKALQMNPNYRHLDPWRVLALEDLGRGQDATARFGKALEKPAAEWNWIDHLLAFQLGRVPGEQLLSAVSQQEPGKSAQRAEAEYFIGRRLARQGQNAEAQAAFRRAVETDARQLSAYRGAKLALGGRR